MNYSNSSKNRNIGAYGRYDEFQKLKICRNITVYVYERTRCASVSTIDIEINMYGMVFVNAAKRFGNNGAMPYLKKNT